MDKPKDGAEVAAASNAPNTSSLHQKAAPTSSSNGMGEEIFFLARKELDFGANHAHTALLLADVDGDGQQELVVGSLDGKLAVYKGLGRTEPWALATGLGMLRVFAKGRVWPWLKATKQSQPRAPARTTFSSATASTEEEAREGEAEEAEPPREHPPQLIAVTVEGDLYVFDFSNAPPTSSSSSSSSAAELEQHASQSSLKDKKSLPSPPPTQQPPSWKLVPSQTLSVEPNVTAALILDVDGDGYQELLLGRMDGAVQVLAWRLPPLPMSPRSAEQDEEEEEEHYYQSAEPELYEKGTGQVSSSVVSLSAVRCEGPNGSSLCVVAGLDTGTVEVLRCFSSGKDEGDAPLSSLVDLRIGGGLPLPHCGWSGPLTCCSLPGGGQLSGSGGFAVAGLDGRLAMGVVEQQQQQQLKQHLANDEDLVWKTVWSLQTTQPFYAVAPFRIGSALSGGSGFAACGWSGLTCLVNADSTGAGAEGEGGANVDVMMFDPSKMLVPPLRGFIAGRFGGRNEFCLFYSCADGHILVFHDLARQLKQSRGESPESEDEAAAAARQLRSEEAQKLVKAWSDLHLASTTSEAGAGAEAEDGSSAKSKGQNAEERPSTGAAPAEGK